MQHDSLGDPSHSTASQFNTISVLNYSTLDFKQRQKTLNELKRKREPLQALGSQLKTKTKERLGHEKLASHGKMYEYSGGPIDASHTVRATNSYGIPIGAHITDSHASSSGGNLTHSGSTGMNSLPLKVKDLHLMRRATKMFTGNVRKQLEQMDFSQFMSIKKHKKDFLHGGSNKVTGASLPRLSGLGGHEFSGDKMPK